MPKILKRLKARLARRQARIQRPKNYLFPEKRLSRETLGAFWKDWNENKRARNLMQEGKGREVIAVSPSVLGTVRIFYSAKQARGYVRRCRAIVTAINASSPKYFEFLPTQILDIKHNMVLERVYPRPTCLNMMSEYYFERVGANRYTKGFFDLMERKGVSQKEVKESVYLAYENLITTINYKHYEPFFDNRRGKFFDYHSGNILVLDYDPKAKKVFFGIMDMTPND